MIEPKRWSWEPQSKHTTQLKHLIKIKTSNLAPIELEILLYWGSVQKIGRDSGTGGLLKPKLLLLKIKKPYHNKVIRFLSRIPDSNRSPLACQASALAK